MRLEKTFSDSKQSKLKKALYSSFAKIGIGREITIIGKKN